MTDLVERVFCARLLKKKMVESYAFTMSTITKGKVVVMLGVYYHYVIHVTRAQTTTVGIGLAC